MRDDMDNNIKGIIFDMDGTLLLSMHVWDNAGSGFLKRHGVTPDPDTDELVKSMTIEQAAEYFIERYGLGMSVEQIASDVDKELENQYFNILMPKPGVLAMLERLHDAGVPCCIATATDRYLAVPALKRTGIYPYIKEIFTCKQVGAGKQTPDIYYAAMSSLGFAKEETAVFEDAPYAAQTAHRAGFFVVGIYDPSFEAGQNRLRESADLYIKDFSELGVSSCTPGSVRLLQKKEQIPPKGSAV